MKKHLFLAAALGMGMAFTSCTDDEQLLPAPSVALEQGAPALTTVEGTALTIAPVYGNVTPTTTYQWLVKGAVVGTEPTLTYTPAEAGICHIVLKVTNINGTTTQTFDVDVKENLKTLDFEGESWSQLIDSKQYNGPLLYGENATSYKWSDAVTGLSGGLSLKWGGGYGYSEGGTAISNYIDADLQNHATYEYQLSVPVSNGSQNFAVVYCDATLSFPEGVNRIIKSMDFAPTTYELGVVMNGDGYAASLKQSGNLTVTITADTGKSMTVDMARDGKILSTWTTVSLASLGKVNSITFTMDGSDQSSFGVKHPKYFAFDNVVVRL